MRSKKQAFEPDWATHPADHLAEYLETRSMSKADLARETGLNRGRITELLQRKRSFTPHIALRLEKALGLKADIWLSLQSNWDLHVQRKEQGE